MFNRADYSPWEFLTKANVSNSNSKQGSSILSAAKTIKKKKFLKKIFKKFKTPK